MKAFPACCRIRPGRNAINEGIERRCCVYGVVPLAFRAKAELCVIIDAILIYQIKSTAGYHLAYSLFFVHFLLWRLQKKVADGHRGMWPGLLY